jgi:hypothetical protein
MLNSSRRNIQYPNPDHSDRPDVPLHIGYLVTALELDMVYQQGTNAQRVAAAHLVGSYWHETDTGLDWYDDGTNWNQVGAQSMTGLLSARPAATAVPAGTLYRATDNGIVYRSDHTNWSLWSVSSGAELDYAQVVTPSAAVSATTEATAAAIVTGNPVTYDGTRNKIEFFCPALAASTGLTLNIVFLRDTTVIGQVRVVTYTTSAALYPPIGEVFDTPSAGAHTYSVKAFVSTGNATIQAGAGGSGNLVPAFLRVTKA